MIKFMKKIRILPIIMLAALVLSACGAAAPAEPTQDPNAIFTQVAETVMVSMTQTSEAMPPTPMPEPTATTAPTLPPAPTVDLAAQPTVGALPIGPTATIQRFGDSAKYNTQTPSDGKIFKPGEYFQFTVCFGNNGSTIWDHTYYLEWISGYRLWNDTKYFYVEDDIDPGGKWCFVTPAVSPPNPGTYITRWYFKNPDKQYMQEVYFNYKVES
ncbi:MAG: NBR1-Ig-like domain-containing protein [Pelolinea sp.]|nr:NBR1-Ig-like domain-containing protein [Pelolinea sp.]